MYAKFRSGILPSFQPYERLQITLSHWVGSDIHPLVPWALSFLNGSIIVSFAFSHLYRRLPGSNSAIKGLIFGVLGWAVMALIFFPLLGMGVFAAQLGARYLACRVFPRDAFDLQHSHEHCLCGIQA